MQHAPDFAAQVPIPFFSVKSVFAWPLAQVVSHLGDGWQACQGWERLVVDEDAAAHGHATPSHSSLWMGGNGSTTQAHYDVLHNIFVQVHGRKRFRMWGPDAHMALRVFPDSHPRARKSQILIDSFPATPDPEIDMTLEPGQALFIPAFWFHHVEALSASVSVNVFSENAMKLAAQNILVRPPPRSVCVSMCIQKYVHIYIYTYICIRMHIYICIDVNKYIHIYINTYIHECKT